MFYTIPDSSPIAVALSEEISCDTICDADEVENSVCGSDYKTYKNSCDLKKAACKSKKAVTVVHLGMQTEFIISHSLY